MTVRISYGGTPKTVDFPEFIWRLNAPDYVRRTLQGTSASGVVETLSIRIDTIVDIAIRHQRNDNATAATFKRNIKQWEQWARYGNDWTLTVDFGDTVLTTITESPEPDDVIVTVDNPTGIVAGRTYVLRNVFDLEVVKVAGIVGQTVLLVEPLNFAFFSGDRFRSEFFWPGRLIDPAPLIIDRPPVWFDVELRFMEDLNGL